MRREVVDVAVIGGGPAGLAAAEGARDAGAGRVCLIERDRDLGGILQQCIHTGFGLDVFREELTGPEYAQRYIEKVRGQGVKTHLGTMVLEVGPGPRLVASSPGGLLEIEAGALVLAMGCRERTRGAIALPGTRPAGVYTAGTAQRFVNLEGLLPGRRAVILGSGDIGMIMARRLTLEGVGVEAVVEMLPYAGGLTRNVVQCLNDFGIPLLLEHTVTQIHGRRRVEGVTVARLDAQRKPVAGSERRIDCDTLLLSVGLLPENELSRAAGVELDARTGGPVVDQFLETSVPGVFAGGNVVMVHDLADQVSRQSAMAGRNAALAAERAAGEHAAVAGRGHAAASGIPSAIPVLAGTNVRQVAPQRLRREGPFGPALEFQVRVAEPEHDVRVVVSWGADPAARHRVKRPIVRPGEMLSFRVPEKVAVEGRLAEAEAVTVDVVKEE